MGLLDKLFFTKEAVTTTVVFSKDDGIDLITDVETKTIAPNEQDLIRAMYNEFDETPKRLLEAAKIILDAEYVSELDTDKLRIANRLRDLGFSKASIVKNIEVQEKQRKTEDAVRNMYKETAENVLYYQQNYPFLKFITVDELTKICRKYGLMSAPVGCYIGDVPEKNIQEIERGQVLKIKDLPDSSFSLHYGKGRWQYTVNNYNDSLYIKSEERDFSVLDQIDPEIYTKHLNEICQEWADGKPSYRYNSVINQFYIAAPKSMFDINELKKLKRQSDTSYIEVIKTDPVVFKYCRGGVLIYSKWGLEASDPALYNPVEN